MPRRPPPPGTGGRREGSGRKPIESTILKSKLGEYAHDAMESYFMVRKWRDDSTLKVEFRYECAKEIMNRHWGKPAQALIHTGNVSILETILKSSEEAEPKPDA